MSGMPKCSLPLGKPKFCSPACPQQHCPCWALPPAQLFLSWICHGRIKSPLEGSECSRHCSTAWAVRPTGEDTSAPSSSLRNLTLMPLALRECSRGEKQVSDELNKLQSDFYRPKEADGAARCAIAPAIQSRHS